MGLQHYSRILHKTHLDHDNNKRSRATTCYYTVQRSTMISSPFILHGLPVCLGMLKAMNVGVITLWTCTIFHYHNKCCCHRHHYHCRHHPVGIEKFTKGMPQRLVAVRDRHPTTTSNTIGNMTIPPTSIATFACTRVWQLAPVCPCISSRLPVKKQHYPETNDFCICVPQDGLWLECIDGYLGWGRGDVSDRLKHSLCCTKRRCMTVWELFKSVLL